MTTHILLRFGLSAKSWGDAAGQTPGWMPRPAQTAPDELAKAIISGLTCFVTT
jgi:hypothetical protein